MPSATSDASRRGILKIPGAGHTEIIETETQGRLLLAYIYDFSVLPATTQTRVYFLPGIRIVLQYYISIVLDL